MSSGGLHILVVDPIFRPPSLAGSCRTFGIVSQLLGAGHRVTLIAGPAAAAMPTVFPSGLTLAVCDVLPPPPGLGAALSPDHLSRGAQFAAKRVASIQDIDVALIAHPESGLARGATATCRRRQTPFVIDERGLSAEPRGILAGHTFRRGRRGAVAALVPSPDFRGWLAAHLRGAAPVAVSPTGADTDLFSSAASSPAIVAAHPKLASGPLVVFAGALTPHRPFGRILEMAALMRRLAPDVAFLICGDGPIRLDLNAHAARLDVLERNLWFAPAVPRDQLPSLLRAATVILAFGSDPAAQVLDSGEHIYDALAVGRPIAVIGGGWQRDLIDSRQAGPVLPADDAAAAARELADFLRDPDLVRRAAEQAAALGRGRLNAARIEGEVRVMLERAAAAQPRSAVQRRKLMARKRAIDLAFSAFGLIVLSPVFVAFGLWLGVTRRRWPVAALQCTGHKGRPFKRLQFATGGRVDGLSRFLDRTGLALTPALANVATGTMSLVGPQPHPISYLHFYSAEQQHRLDMKPGLTSYASEAVEASPTWEGRFGDDLWYGENISLGLDLRLIAGALWRGLTGRRRSGNPGLPGFDVIMERRQGGEDA